MRQLCIRDTFDPQHRHELSAKEKSEVLDSHMFLKLNRDGKIKGQAVAGRNKQINFISKEEASSSMVETEAMLLSCVIDAQEHQDVATINIPNTFIQTCVDKIKDMATIIMKGALVDVLVEISPDIYGLYFSNDKKGVKNMILR